MIVPESSGERKKDDRRDRGLRFEELVMAMLKDRGFSATLRSLKTRAIASREMMTVYDGVLQESPSGFYDAALQTNKGRVVLQGARRTDRESTDDPQLVRQIVAGPDAPSDSNELSSEKLLLELAATSAPSASLICAVELTRFSPSQQAALLDHLWNYIVRFRDRNNRDDLVSVGAAIRKYIVIMPMDRMGELAYLLESGHRSQTPIDLEIEVAKMVYRNFEVHPSSDPDPHPELAARLWEMAQAYINPRILLRDKHSAAASLAIEAIVSMRSHLARQALTATIASPFRWFAELVSDDLDALYDSWRPKNAEAAAWLRDLHESLFAQA